MTTSLVFKSQEDFQNHCTQHESQTFVSHKDIIYNVSEFLEDHPGGPAWILEFKSKDISEVFHDDDYHDHSDSALRILYKYKVGYIKAQEEQAEKKHEEVEAYPRITKDKVEYKDFTIDLNRGMVPQVFKLNKKQYMHMIHNSIHLPHCRLFDGDLWESLSRNPWHRIPMVWFPLCAILMYFGLTFNYPTHSSTDKYIYYGSPDFSVLAVMLTFLISAFAFTLIEYCLHRGVFHFDDYLPDNKWAIHAHFLIHGIHHTIPMDPDRLVFPPLLGAGVYAIFFPTIISFFPGNLGRIITAGLIIGYVAYDMTHIYIHHCTPFIEHLKEMKKYHNKHHYVDGNRGYGITTKIWDKVFRTELL